MPESIEQELLVDGFNIAHAWEELRLLFKQGTDVVVERLTSDLKCIHDVRRLRVTVVFDGKGESLDVAYPFADESFRRIFSPASLTADGVIEQLVAKSPNPGAIYVASRDQAI